MYNADDGGRIVYPVTQIIVISARDEVCTIELTDGTIHQHPRKIETDETIDLTAIVDYQRTDLHNTTTIIKRQFPNWKECLYYDLMDGRIWINPSMYGGKNELKPYIGDGSDLLQILDNLCQLTDIITENGKTKTIRFNPKKETVADAIEKLSRDNERNSFIERIRRIEWDGKPRIDTFLWEIGCRSDLVNDYDQDLYLRFVGRAIFLVAIDRSLNTDYRSIPFMPILIGKQGSGKTNLCRRLGMDWYRGTITEMTNEKKFYESSNGSAILELTEGTQFNNTSMEVMKAFIEKDRIQFRGSYERHERTIPIKFLMIATTNNMKPLSDGSGNRRFYPIVKTRDVLEKQIEDYSEDEILQLWAEALSLYDNGSRWDDDLNNEEMTRIFKIAQELVTQYPAPFNELKDYLDANYPNVGDRISNSELRDFFDAHGYYGKDCDRSLQTFAKYYAMGFGFKSLKPTPINGKISRGYERV